MFLCQNWHSLEPFSTSYGTLVDVSFLPTLVLGTENGALGIRLRYEAGGCAIVISIKRALKWCS